VVEATDSALVDVVPNTYIYDDVPTSPILITPRTACFSGNQIFRTFEVTDEFTVGDVDVGFNATHGARGEIWAFLISPQGTRVELFEDEIIAEEIQNYDVLFDDSSTNPIDDGDDDDVGEPYYERTVKPYRPLSPLNGEPAFGTWTLEICDKFAAIGPGQGSYNRSRLILQDLMLSANKTADKLKLQPGQGISYNIEVVNHSKAPLFGVEMTDTIPAEVSYRPRSLVASSGVAAESRGLIAWTGDIAPGAGVTIEFATDLAIPGPGLITNTAYITHSILYAPLSPTIVSQVFVQQDYLYTNEDDAPIPDGELGCVAPITQTIYVPDSFPIGDVRVGVTLDHTLRGDLILELTAPSGTHIPLLDSVGWDQNMDVMLTDSGPENSEIEFGDHDTGAPYYDNEARPDGGNEAYGPLSAFDSQDAQGEWSLRICDDILVDTGTLRQWSLFFKEANVWLGYTSSWEEASNWSLNRVPTMEDFALIWANPLGGFYPVLGAPAAVNNLMVKPEASVDLSTYQITAEEYISNTGTISQTRPVTVPETPVEILHITNASGDTTEYLGVVITPTVNSLGDVTVGISGVQTDGCTDVATDALATRCFNIQPSQPVSSSVRFYFTESERNQQVANALKVWDRGSPPSQWRQVGGNYTYSEIGDLCESNQYFGCWILAEGVETYGPLVLGSATPPTLAISQVTDGVRLAWTHVESNVDHYEVWRSPSPYFYPGSGGSTKLQDIPVDPSNVYEYVDTSSAVGSIGDNSYFTVRTVYTNGQTTDANAVGEFDFGLTPGAPPTEGSVALYHR
jgi:uncharacterized repeat protein (TIGR01451 family)